MEVSKCRRGRSKIRKAKQRLKAAECKRILKSSLDECRAELQQEKKVTEMLSRRIKTSQERLSSFKMELGRVRSGIPTQTFATPSYRYTIQNSDLARCVRRIPSSLFRVDEGISLGEGSFGKCMKGYMQGIEVCLKQIKSSPRDNAKTSLLREASILSKLYHETVCFLHGIQCDKEPYYLVTNLYVIDGFSITIYDFLCLSAKDDSSKRRLVHLLHSDITMDSWCLIMKDVAHGLHYIHCDHQIIHRDLKSNNIVLYRQRTDLKPVIIDFGKSVHIHKAMRYNLTEGEKQQYRQIHKHIAPDLIDGICVPSPSSDMYSYGRVFKNIVGYSQRMEHFQHLSEH